jgi:hypothetical protein
MTEFPSLDVVGGLLPSSLLDRIFAGDPQVPGTAPLSYGLERGESVRRQASRSWLYLLEIWQDHKQRVTGPDAAEATSARVTRERWLRILLRELGFHQVTSGSFEIDGKTFPVSNRSGHVPIHLLGWDTDLDHKTPHVTARAPQSMLQELLNRDDRYLWAILSNGTTLRLLRDSASLTGSAYLEFDLAAIFDGELFPDFVLLYLVCHESRFAVQGDGGPGTCYLEQWRGFAAEQGERALNQLRGGVQEAISILGTGFLSNRANPQLRTRLANAELTLDDLNRALLRLVYRLLFWFVAEDRDLLLQPDPADADDSVKARLREARDRYATYFSSARLRRMARRHRGGRHSDLFDAAELVFDALGTEGGVPELALPGIGGIFETKRDDGSALPLDEPLAGARLSNEALLGAVRALSQIRPRDGGPMRSVDFGNLGAEELGSVYESLLELIPRYDAEQLSYTLETLPGNERKETGSYYTPTSLVDSLLDSALDPLLDEACAKPTPGERVAALLDITVCDPACGSGHFLVAAARRIAKRVAAEEIGESEPPDAVVRAALRRVVGRCIYGVDVNPMAAELARVSLWLEALEPGKPLSYLDESIRVGNSLLGVTPALLADGLPDAAFKPIEGDDRKVAAALKKQNAAERAGQHDLFSPAGIPVSNAVLAKRAAAVAHVLPESLEDLHIHQQRQATELAESPEHHTQKLLADAWCAAFVQPKTEETRATAITQAILKQFGVGSSTLDLAAVEDLVTDLARKYRFFHWHIEFPHIFRIGNGSADLDPATGWSGGFSCVIGNPPWEKVELREQEFFAQRDPWIAEAPTADERKKRITQLLTSGNPADEKLHAEFKNELRKSSGWTHLLKETGRYPLTGRGRLNTYAVFAETASVVIGSRGRSGLVLPTGIATDATTARFFGSLVRHARLVSFLDFENEAFLLSHAVDHRVRFCLLTVCGRATRVNVASFAFGTRYMPDLAARRFTMPPEEILLVNPNTGTTPVFRSRRDAEITIGIYKRVPVLWRDDPDENPWGLSFMQGIFNMASDSGLFWTREHLERDGWTLRGNVFVRGNKHMLPLYEAKMIHYFDHRFGTYEGQTEAQANVGTLPRLTLEQHDDSECTVLPRYWVAETEVDERLSVRGWDEDWLLGWRDITNATNERTMICCVLPREGVGHTFPLMLSASERLGCLYANLASFILDYVARQKIAGTHLTYGYINQLSVLTPSTYEEDSPWDIACSLHIWIETRVLELTYTAADIAPFATYLRDDGSPFQWIEDRRFRMRAELDAAFFHLYRIERHDLDYIMDTFVAFQNNDRTRFERTKELILQVYDAMAEAMRTGSPYRTILNPPPGQGPRHG